MKKFVAIILTFVFISNTLVSTALASGVRNPLPIPTVKVTPAPTKAPTRPIQTAPPVKVACLPVCAVPFLPQIGTALGTLLAWILALGTATATVVLAYEVSTTIDKMLGKRKKQTIIYRRGTPTCMNMTPRNDVDVRTGLPKDWKGISYQLSRPLPPYTATSLEALQESGYFVAYQDGIDHVSVRGLSDADHANWLNARPKCDDLSIKTEVLVGMSVHVKR